MVLVNSRLMQSIMEVARDLKMADTGSIDFHKIKEHIAEPLCFTLHFVFYRISMVLCDFGYELYERQHFIHIVID